VSFGGTHDVDVIVVAHNAGGLLRACVDSAVCQAPPERVIVVDSGSTDGSVDVVKGSHPAVRIVCVENRGFAAANNVGLKATTGAYAILLNPDAELAEGAVQALVRCAELHPRAAIVGAKVLGPDGSLQSSQSGSYPTLPQVLGLRVWRAWQRLRGNTAYSPKDFSRARMIEWVTGACMLVRRSAIEEVGPMDEGYFLYYEDTEWCHRMRDHGWEVWQAHDARIVHRRGQSGGQSEFARRAYRESFFRYCDQYHLWGLKASARAGLMFRSALLRDHTGGTP
jgi:N-acetylglucosaminyl-diphospho-decaprenol L-rhamnosyltransferase